MSLVPMPSPVIPVGSRAKGLAGVEQDCGWTYLLCRSSSTYSQANDFTMATKGVLRGRVQRTGGCDGICNGISSYSPSETQSDARNIKPRWKLEINYRLKHRIGVQWFGSFCEFHKIYSFLPWVVLIGPAITEVIFVIVRDCQGGWPLCPIPLHPPSTRRP